MTSENVTNRNIQGIVTTKLGDISFYADPEPTLPQKALISRLTSKFMYDLQTHIPEYLERRWETTITISLERF